jgi:hypothetical protein
MRKILILILLAFSLTAWGTKYYVDAAGNDGTGDGSVGNPWALVSYACTQVTTPGDTIYVNPGTINESARINLARGVHLLGDSTDIPKIISTYRDASYYAVWLHNETLQDGNQSISYLHFDGSDYTAYGGIMISRRNNVDIHHCTISYFEFWGGRFLVPNSVGELSPTRASGNKFRHNTVINSAGYGANGYGGCGMDGQEDFYIGYNDFIQKNTPGLNGMPIKCVNGNIKNGKIVYNNIYQNPFTSGEHWDFSIEIWDIRGGVEIAYNYCEGSIDLSGKINVKGEYDYCAWVHHNVIGQPTQSLYEHTRGFILEAHLNNEDIIIEKNYVKNTATGLGFGQPEPSEATVFKNIRISHNIFESMGITDALATHSKGWGIKSSDPADWQTVDNWEVYNNVITAKEGTYSTMWGIMIPPMVSTNIKIRNNIVVGFDYAGVFGYNNGDPDITCDILSIENNCFYGNGNSNLPRYGNGYTPTNNTTQNNIIADPLFKSSTDFHLQSTSPCRDAGIDVSAITGGLDFLGASLYGAAYDIGAFEYQGTGRVLLIIDDKIATINYKIPLIEH